MVLITNQNFTNKNQTKEKKEMCYIKKKTREI